MERFVLNQLFVEIIKSKPVRTGVITRCLKEETKMVEWVAQNIEITSELNLDSQEKTEIRNSTKIEEPSLIPALDAEVPKLNVLKVDKKRVF